jgi:hypothetical protein
VDAAASGARGDRRAGLTCERCVSARTNSASMPLLKLPRAAHGLSKFWRGCCGRRRRVVLASVADAKPAEMRRPNRAWTRLNPRGDGDKRNSSPGRARSKPLKPLRGERPGDCRRNRGDCRVLSTCCTRAAGASGARLSPCPQLSRGSNAIQTSGAMRRETVDGCLHGAGGEGGRCLIAVNMVAIAPRLLRGRNSSPRFNRHRRQLLPTPLFSHTPP